MNSNMYIIGWEYFIKGSSYVLHQPSTAGLAITKADIAKKSYHSYLSRCYVPWIQMCKITIFFIVNRATLYYTLWAFLGWHSKIGGICHPQNELQMA